MIIERISPSRDLMRLPSPRCLLDAHRPCPCPAGSGWTCGATPTRCARASCARLADLSRGTHRSPTHPQPPTTTALAQLDTEFLLTRAMPCHPDRSGKRRKSGRRGVVEEDLNFVGLGEIVGHPLHRGSGGDPSSAVRAPIARPSPPLSHLPLLLLFRPPPRVPLRASPAPRARF